MPFYKFTIQDADTLALEVQELEKAITLGEEMIANCHVAIQALTEQEEEAKKRHDEAKVCLFMLFMCISRF